MSSKDRIVLLAGELGGTALLLFLGCMGCVTEITPDKSIPHLQVAFTFGLTVMMAVQIFGHISGTHINPVVTIAAVLRGEMPLANAPYYFVGQLAGAVLGFSLLKAVTPAEFLSGSITNNTDGTITKTVGICSPSISPHITSTQAFIVEFAFTFILVLLCCSVWDHRNKDKTDSIPVRFGLSIAGLAMAGGAYSGAHLNPVRSFVPALFNGDWDDHWVYWIGPLSAGFIAPFFYKYVYSTEPPKETEAPEDIPLNEKI